jgi:N4-gp56 family major capsid protein
MSNAAPDQGATVTFTLMNDLTAATTPLSETVDVDARELTDSQVSLTLAEYGDAAITTFRARATSFVPLDRTAVNRVGFSAGLTMDTLASGVMNAGTNVIYATGGATTPTSRATIDADDTLTSHDLRVARATLAGASVRRIGGAYVGMIHTDVAVDLAEETDAGGWREPHTYGGAGSQNEIWNGEIGKYEGIRFIESPRAFVEEDGGAGGTVDAYGTLIFGDEALAKGYSTYEGRGAQPIVILGPVTDKLKRLQPVGWHWFGKFGIFRQAALVRIESSSSLGTNV